MAIAKDDKYLKLILEITFLEELPVVNSGFPLCRQDSVFEKVAF